MSDMSELMLSTSMDWTIKLWYPKNEISDQPIFTFESSQEYVYDVQWSPVHPSVFAAVDGDGFIDVWDINKDTEQPLARKKAFENAQGAGGYRENDQDRALSTLKWSTDGRRIAIGDSDGFVSIWNVDKDIYIPKQSDFDQLEQLIQDNSTEASQRRKAGHFDDKDFD
jgi:dynein intermediate chain